MLKIVTLLIVLLAFNSVAHCQSDSLSVYRRQIDSLDSQLIQLLGKRMEVVTAIGIFKAVHHIPPLQSKRFEEILHKNIVIGQGVQLSESFIRDLMEAIHKESLAKENALLKK
jgi:chorismate mutase